MMTERPGFSGLSALQEKDGIENQIENGQTKIL
jgi:hypothetical protein